MNRSESQTANEKLLYLEIGMLQSPISILHYSARLSCSYFKMPQARVINHAYKDSD
jgi:hypothetical protein